MKVAFTDCGIKDIVDAAWQVNETTENIGARRLHTMMERLVEDLSFNADQRSGETISIDEAYVSKILSDVIKDEDLSRFIL